jgi:hypothetical protein
MSGDGWCFGPVSILLLCDAWQTPSFKVSKFQGFIASSRNHCLETRNLETL